MLKRTTLARIGKFIPLSLIAILFIATIAAAPANLPVPATPTAVGTANAGEIRVDWQEVPGARFYVIGWINRNDYDRIGSSGDWLSAFHYATVPAANRNYTVSGLKAGEEYWVLLGARAERFHGEAVSWSAWTGPVMTSGAHGAGLCPITGLPIPAGGYLGIGDTVSSPIANQSFTLTSASFLATVMLHYADDPTQQFSPRPGRRLVEVCGTYRHHFRSAVRFSGGSESVMTSDAGIGFIHAGTHERIDPGVDEIGCQLWDVPAGAQTVIYAVGLGGYNSSAGVVGTDHNNIGLYRIDAPAN